MLVFQSLPQDFGHILDIAYIGNDYKNKLYRDMLLKVSFSILCVIIAVMMKGNVLSSSQKLARIKIKYNGSVGKHPQRLLRKVGIGFD